MPAKDTVEYYSHEEGRWLSAAAYPMSILVGHKALAISGNLIVTLSISRLLIKCTYSPCIFQILSCSAAAELLTNTGQQGLII